MKILARIFILSALIVSFAGCDDDDEDAYNTTTFTAALNGANDVPPKISDATGMATLVFNEDTNKATLTVTYSGLTATNAHIHKGAVGVAGPVVFPIDVTASPLTLENFALTSQEEADLKNGLYYVNIHSDAYPDGEIRGQLAD
jgi:hypothetical protein